MTTLSLLDWTPPASNDDTAPYQPHSETSRAAAASIDLGRLQAKALEHFERNTGLTDEELTRLMGLSPSTVRPRRIELVSRGLVVDSGETRPSRATGRAMTVWRLATYYERMNAAKSPKELELEALAELEQAKRNLKAAWAKLCKARGILQEAE